MNIPLSSGWLSSQHDPLGYVDRIDRRIEGFTGLTMETAEQLQVSLVLYFPCTNTVEGGGEGGGGEGGRETKVVQHT